MTKKILVVEDEPASLKILRYFLSHEGYETAGANDGLEAKELLGQSRFDLVLSDVKMPRLDGVALARHLLSTLPIHPYLSDDWLRVRQYGSYFETGRSMLGQASFIGPVVVANSEGAWAAATRTLTMKH